MQTGAVNLELYSASGKVIVPRRAGGNEGDVYPACGSDKIQQIDASQHLGITVERQPLGNRLCEDSCLQLSQRGGQPSQVIRIACRGDVRVGSDPGKSLEAGSQGANEHEVNVMLSQDSYDPLRIQSKRLSHAAPQLEIGRYSEPRSDDPPE